MSKKKDELAKQGETEINETAGTTIKLVTFHRVIAVKKR